MAGHNLGSAWARARPPWRSQELFRQHPIAGSRSCIHVLRSVVQKRLGPVPVLQCLGHCRGVGGWHKKRLVAVPGYAGLGRAPRQADSQQAHRAGGSRWPLSCRSPPWRGEAPGRHVRGRTGDGTGTGGRRTTQPQNLAGLEIAAPPIGKTLPALFRFLCYHPSFGNLSNANHNPTTSSAQPNTPCERPCPLRPCAASWPWPVRSPTTRTRTRS